MYMYIRQMISTHLSALTGRSIPDDRPRHKAHTRACRPVTVTHTLSSHITKQWCIANFARTDWRGFSVSSSIPAAQAISLFGYVARLGEDSYKQGSSPSR